MSLLPAPIADRCAAVTGVRTVLRRRGRLRAARYLATACIGAAIATAAGAAETALLSNPAAMLGDELAYTIDLDGTRIVTGSPGEATATGAAYVFECDSRPCAAPIRIAAADLAAGDRFGAAVALSGDTLAVSAFGQSPGAVYVFVYTGTAWTQQAKITAGSGAERFGNALALDADRLAIGAEYADARAGAAYVFARSGTAWTQQARLSAADASAGDRFARSVALRGDTLLIGAPLKAGASAGSFGRGAAYAFVGSGGTWTQQAKLVATAAADGDMFGQAVAIDGDRALVGAPLAANRVGSAYVFERNGGMWMQQAQLAAAGSAVSDSLGWSVALSGDTALVGAPYALGTCGVSHVFRNAAGTWTESAGASISAPLLGDLAGWVVAARDGRWVVGTPGHTGPWEHYGAAYYFDAIDTVFGDGFDSASAKIVCAANQRR